MASQLEDNLSPLASYKLRLGFWYLIFVLDASEPRRSHVAGAANTWIHKVRRQINCGCQRPHGADHLQACAHTSHRSVSNAVFLSLEHSRAFNSASWQENEQIADNWFFLVVLSASFSTLATSGYHTASLPSKPNHSDPKSLSEETDTTCLSII